MLIGEEIKNHGGKFSMEARCWKRVNQASKNRVESIIGYDKNEFQG